MRARTAVILVVALVAAVAVWAEIWDPTFLRWLDPDDPDDQTILVYWQKVEAGEATPQELVDLGTLLAERDSPAGGYPKDAIRLFKLALDADPDLAEAWFRIGLLEHRRGEWGAARKSYGKCLKIQEDHAWSLFYLGLLEEGTGNPSAAAEHYQRAFAAAPALADPAHNPELLYARMALGARIGHGLATRSSGGGLVTFLEAEKVKALHDSFLPEPEPPIPPPAAPDVAPPPRAVVTPEPEVATPAPEAPTPPAPVARTRSYPTPDPARDMSSFQRGGFRGQLRQPALPGGGELPPLPGEDSSAPTPVPTPAPTPAP